MNVLIVIVKFILGFFKKPSPPAPAASPVPADSFEAAFPWIIKWEGSDYEDVPGDDGGATKYGIDAESHPEVNIKNLTLEGAKEIYLQEWRNCLANDLSYPLNIVYFNYHVNAGPSRANKLLQAALGLPQDGIIGPASKAAISIIKDYKAVGIRVVNAADEFYRGLAKSVSHDAQFLQGWINRDTDLKKTFLS